MDEGPWPQTFPAKLLAKLKAITDEEIKQVAPKWAKIEELENAKPADLAKYLKGLRAFLNEHPGPFFLVNSL